MTDGLFILPGLPVGPYRLEVALQGFRTSIQTGIVLQVNSNPNVPVVLELGTVAGSHHRDRPTRRRSRRATLGIGQVMDNKRILELPLNGRNPADLLQFLPAAVPQPQLNATSRSMGGSSGGQAYSLAGGLAFGVSWILDGAMHNNPYDNLNLPLPFPDALQEFRAETSAMTAQNGMHSGGAVNAVTKSGTNSFRGDAFEFFRHHSMNATDPFATKNPDGSRKDDGLKRNQYGVDDRRTDQDRQPVLLLRLSGHEHDGEPDRQPRVRADRGDAGGRLHGVRVAGLQCRRAAQPAARRSSATGSTRRCSARRRSTSRRRLPTTTDPCGLVQYGLPSETDEWQQVAKVDYHDEREALAVRPLHRDVAVHAAAVQPRGGAAEPAGHAHRRPRQPGADVHARRELRHQLEHAERGSLRVQPHRHPPHEHRLLLRAGSGHQHLQLHAALHAAERHRRLPARRRNGEPVHVRHALLADQRRPDARARRPSVRVRRDARAAGSRCRWPTSARPASSRSTARSPASGSPTSCWAGWERTGSSRRRRTRSTWKAEVPRAVRAGHVASRPARDVQLRPALGAVLPAAARERRRLSVRHGRGSTRAPRARCSRMVRPVCTSRAIPASRRRRAC